MARAVSAGGASAGAKERVMEVMEVMEVMQVMQVM
jgi:hypothetical protein